MKKTRNDGFTLVELIVVIVILAILLGVTIGGIYSWIEKARINTDINNAKALDDVLVAMSISSDYIAELEDSGCILGNRSYAETIECYDEFDYSSELVTGFMLRDNPNLPFKCSNLSDSQGLCPKIEIVFPTGELNGTRFGFGSEVRFFIQSVFKKYVDEFPQVQSKNDALYIYIWI